MNALTKTPATILGIYNEVGSLEAGKWANFLITSGPIFNEKTSIFQNWVQGIKYVVKDEAAANVQALINLTVNFPTGTANYTLDVKSSSSANHVLAKDTMNTKFSFDGRMVKLSYAPMTRRQRPPGLKAAEDGQDPAEAVAR